MNLKQKGYVFFFTIILMGANLYPSASSDSAVKTSSGKDKKISSCSSYENDTDYYAVICACSRYQNPKNNIPRGMPAPESKLRVLYDTLLQTNNWDANHIILLLNKNATKQNITQALEKMATMVDSNDIFLFTWNGHGSRIPDDDGDEAFWNPNDMYDEIICPYDTNKSEENFTNILTDDELQFYFSHIKAKGKCLIFESCLSGSLVDHKTIRTAGDLSNLYLVGTSLFEPSFLKGNKNQNTMDVNDNNTVVILSTKPSTLGRATFTTHSPLLYSIAHVIAKPENYDKNTDGFLSVEEAFRISKPMTQLHSFAYWAFFWFYMYLFFKLDIYKLYSTYLPWLFPRIITLYSLFDKVVPFPVISGSCLFLLFYLDVQLFTKLRTGFYVLNWPNMQDDYPGELPLVQI